jgi:hypothetical protein
MQLAGRHSLTRDAVETTCTNEDWTSVANRLKQMGSTLFGNANLAVVVSVMPQDMMIVRGMNGCAMASDRQ